MKPPYPNRGHKSPRPVSGPFEDRGCGISINQFYILTVRSDRQEPADEGKRFRITIKQLLSDAYYGGHLFSSLLPNAMNVTAFLTVTSTAVGTLSSVLWVGLIWTEDV